MRWFFVLVVCLSVFQASAQDKGYAKQLLKVLCSPQFHGRGYSNKGDQKAAAFIRREMNANNLKSFDGFTFYQPFTLSANTFPKKVELSVNDQELLPGTDFLLEPYSSSCKGTYEVVYFDKSIYRDSTNLAKFAQKSHKKEIIVFNNVHESDPEVQRVINSVIAANSFGAAAVINLVDKLGPFSPSTFQANFCSLKILRAQWPTQVESVHINVHNKWVEDYTTNNVLGYIPGRTDTTILFTAHYDHIGRLGKHVYFPGAHDNASGVAMLLNLARHYGKSKTQPHYTYAFIAFSGEEAGLLGSQYYVEHPLFPLENIKILLNLDLLGSGEEGITIVNGAVFKKEYQQLDSLNTAKGYLTSIQARGEAANSDHYPFYKKGVTSFFIYTRGAYKEYHSVNDKAENVPLNAYDQLFKLLVDYVAIQ